MSTSLSKNYFVLTAIVLLLFSIGLLFLPAYVMRLLAITYSEAGAVFIQFLGASLAGHAYLNWRTRAAPQDVIKPVITMNIVALLLAVVISLVAILHNARIQFELPILLMHLAFLSGFFIVLRRIH